MHYVLNGGRNERGVLANAESRALYSELGITNVLFVVYALVEDFWQFSWKKAHTLIRIPGMQIRSLTIYDTDPAVIAEAMQWADFIYFPGGSQETLLKRMVQLDATTILRQTVNDGTITLLGGGSAGAMVMGSWCMFGRSEVKNVVPGLSMLPDYIIDSHFSERNRLPRLQAVIADKGTNGLGIDEDTAVVFDEHLSIMSVFGPGTVTVCNETVTVYDSNSTF